MPPVSGLATIRLSSFKLLIYGTKTYDAYNWSTGILKNAPIWSECKSIVTTLVAPAVSKKFTINFEVIPTLGLSFLS